MAKPAPASRTKFTFGQVEVGPVIVGASACWIGMAAEEVPPHAVPLMVMPSDTLPLGPALKVMVVVPWPAVMLPFAMVQAYVAPETGETLALLPVLFAQTAGGAAIGGVGEPANVTVLLALLLQFEALVTVTLYVVVAAGVSVIVCVVAPFDQRYEEKPGPASRVIGVPAQKVDGPVMLTSGAGFTVTLLPALVALQPFTVTLTVNVPEPKTVIDCVVAPFDQR